MREHSRQNGMSAGAVNRRKSRSPAWLAALLEKVKNGIKRHRRAAIASGLAVAVSGAGAVGVYRSRMADEAALRVRARTAEFDKIGIKNAKQFAMFSTTSLGKRHEAAFDSLPSGVRAKIIAITEKAFAKYPDGTTNGAEMLSRSLDALSGSKGDFEARVQERLNRLAGLKGINAKWAQEERDRLLRGVMIIEEFDKYTRGPELRPDAYKKIVETFK